jgi:hypothetical protein
MGGSKGAKKKGSSATSPMDDFKHFFKLQSASQEKFAEAFSHFGTAAASEVELSPDMDFAAFVEAFGGSPDAEAARECVPVLWDPQKDSVLMVRRAETMGGAKPWGFFSAELSDADEDELKQTVISCCNANAGVDVSMEYEGVELATFNNTTYALLSFDSEKALTGGPGVESLGWISLKQVVFKIGETPYSAGTKSALGKLCQQFNHHLFALVQRVPEFTHVFGLAHARIRPTNVGDIFKDLKTAWTRPSATRAKSVQEDARAEKHGVQGVGQPQSDVSSDAVDKARKKLEKCSEAPPKQQLQVVLGCFKLKEEYTAEQAPGGGYNATVTLSDNRAFHGFGRGKKNAEQEAAKKAVTGLVYPESEDDDDDENNDEEEEPQDVMEEEEDATFGALQEEPAIAPAAPPPPADMYHSGLWAEALEGLKAIGLTAERHVYGAGNYYQAAVFFSNGRQMKEDLIPPASDKETAMKKAAKSVLAFVELLDFTFPVYAPEQPRLNYIAQPQLPPEAETPPPLKAPVERVKKEPKLDKDKAPLSKAPPPPPPVQASSNQNLKQSLNEEARRAKLKPQFCDYGLTQNGEYEALLMFTSDESGSVEGQFTGSGTSKKNAVLAACRQGLDFLLSRKRPADGEQPGGAKKVRKESGPRADIQAWCESNERTADWGTNPSKDEPGLWKCILSIQDEIPFTSTGTSKTHAEDSAALVAMSALGIARSA